MAYNKDNSGILGRNKYKKTDGQPEYTGKATIGGVEYRIAAWVKEGNDGKFFSLVFQLPREDGQASAAPKTQEIDDDIPF